MHVLVVGADSAIVIDVLLLAVRARPVSTAVLTLPALTVCVCLLRCLSDRYGMASGVAGLTVIACLSASMGSR